MRNDLRAAFPAALVLAGAAAAGCLPAEDSCDIATEDIEVEFAAIEENGAAAGEAIFRTGDVSSIALGDCGDKITVNGERMRVLSGSASPLIYAASIEVADEYEFVFSRPDEDDYVSTVSDLRPEVTITAPAAGSIITRDTGFDITWANNDAGEINLLIDGDCIRSYPDAAGESVTDDGADAVPPNGLVWSGTEGTETPTTCDAEVVLTRSVEGTLDAALTGAIHGWTAGRAAFTSAPAPE
jgi:hypothetical protein